MEKAKVYFCREITPENVVKMYDALGIELPGNVAVKVHSGEAGNQNYLRPDFMVPMVKHVDGTVVECNTAYAGERNSTKKHLKTIREHGWDTVFEKFDLMDAEGPDKTIPVPNGKILKEDYLGKNIEKYDSMLVLSHFKGHPMGGYGGALKQLSIGCASRRGKAYIHGAGTTEDADYVWEHLPLQNDFLASMADAASSVVKYFDGKIAYINVMKNMSVDCDCCAVAEDPCLKDIGILASLDPVAIDQACIDLVKKSEDPGKEHFLERVNSRNGEHTIRCAEELGVGTREYELISID